ncbi:MAG: type II toxin-antitoxin system VapC family toxin [Myxococcaceae bacterium]
MVLDTSAALAILLGEPEREAFAQAIADAPVRLMSAISGLEAALVIETRKGPAGGRELDLLLHAAKVELVAFSSEQFALARAGWRKFGKGRHRAGLNFGDCCAYALALQSGEPLLYKGNDFSHTDLPAAVAPH